MKSKEEKLLTNLKNRKRDALDKAILLYSGYVGKIVYNIIGQAMTKEDVEEVISDVFLTLWTHTDALDPSKGCLHSYLAAIARSRAKNKLRVKNDLYRLEDDELILSALDPSSDPEGIALRKELAQVLSQVIDQMKEPERELFLRYYYQYQSVNEISEILSLNPSTVKTKLARGRKKLKEALCERGYDCE